MENLGDRRLRPRRPDDPFLLYDIIIMEIVSRLPAKDASKFRCVCKRGRNLIARRDFIESHIRHISTAPMILVMNINKRSVLLEKFGVRGRFRSKVLKFSLYQCLCPENYRVLLSQDGLVVSRGYGNTFIIFNHVYREKVTITFPSGKLISEICGVFYHSGLKEYCTLWETTTELEVQYKMLNLGSQPNWREIRNPWTQNYTRIKDILPVLVNSKYLYWIVEDAKNHNNNKIMEFDTTNERFEVIPCPVLELFSTCNASNTNLLNVGDVLLLVQVFDTNEQMEVYINIWTLKDRVKKLWTRSEYSVRKNACLGLGQFIKVIALLNGEFIVQSGLQLFVCDLKLETIKKFGRMYKSAVGFTAHVMSFASLKNCKSHICVEENCLI